MRDVAEDIKWMTSAEKVAFSVAYETLEEALRLTGDERDKGIYRAEGMVEGVALLSDLFDNMTDAVEILWLLHEKPALAEKLYEKPQGVD